MSIFKYKKGDIITKLDGERYALIEDCIIDKNHYHYYSLVSVCDEFINRYVDKHLLENATKIDIDIDRKRKIKRLYE